MTRTLTLRARTSPTRRISRASRARSSFGCSSSGSSPISSRKTVPPSAASKAPTRSRSAPVKAPRTCPNSSLSTSAGEMAPQSTMMNGLSARRPRLTISVATSSLPVPLSPWMSTLISLCEILSRVANSLRIGRLVPTIAPKVGTRVTVWCASSGLSVVRTRTAESPTRSKLSTGRSASRSMIPSMRVPLSEPVSFTRHTPSSRTRRQWKRETDGSASTMSFEAWVPMRQVSPSCTTGRWAITPFCRSTMSVRRGSATVSDAGRALGGGLEAGGGGRSVTWPSAERTDRGGGVAGRRATFSMVVEPDARLHPRGALRHRPTPPTLAAGPARSERG